MRFRRIAEPKSSSASRVWILCAFAAVMIGMLGCVAHSRPPGAISGQSYRRGIEMLDQLKADLKELYYDSTFGGVNLDMRVRLAKEDIRAAASEAEMFGVIAQVLADLEDSHTFFYPPELAHETDYGFNVLFVGDTCYITDVADGSPAEAAGLEVGDAVLRLDRFDVDRETFWILEYVYLILQPRQRIRMVVRGPGGRLRRIEFRSIIHEGIPLVYLDDPDVQIRLREQWRESARAYDHSWIEFGDSVLIWRMPAFRAGDEDVVNDMIERAREYNALVLDLRGNAGGAVESLLHLTGSFFKKDVRIGTLVTRNSREALVAEAVDDPYTGQFVVLVNSGSASAAEVLARILQIEDRATIVGDRTMGSVMISRRRVHEVGFTQFWLYGASITVADIVMSDGGRLEDVGVIPDERVLPSAADLAADRDPAFARALSLVGIAISAAEAGRLSEELRGSDGS